MKKKPISKEVLSLSILTTLTILTWIIFSIYQIFQKPLILKIPQEELKPLNPVLDNKTLNSLKTRKIINLNEITSIPELTKFQLKEKEPFKESSESGKEASPSSQEIR